MSRIDEKFQREIIHDNIPYLLDQVVEWIKANYDPPDVFDEKTLEEWARDNDFIKKDEEAS